MKSYDLSDLNEIELVQVFKKEDMILVLHIFGADSVLSRNILWETVVVVNLTVFYWIQM